jgi:uncharacterized membrane protein
MEVMRQAIDTLYWTPEWLVALLFVGLMVMACETGYALGLRSRAAEKTKAMVPTIAASILALLGLLLGFTMSMSVSRYDSRRRLVLEEANALMSAYRRAQVLPAPENTKLQQLLRQYAGNRLRVSQNALDPRTLQQAKEEDAHLQGELWAEAAVLAQRNPQSVPAGLLLESLDNAFSLENSRWISFVAHLPEGLIYVNALMGLVAALMVGYDFGITGNRHPLSEALVIISIMMVLTLIVELDHPHSGVIRVSQQPLVDLQRRLAAPSH